MRKAGFDLGNTKSPIIPVYIGNEELSMMMSQRLYEQGIFAQSIQYPFVAENQARIRVILSASHSSDDLDEAIQGFIHVGKELRIIPY